MKAQSLINHALPDLEEFRSDPRIKLFSVLHKSLKTSVFVQTKSSPVQRSCLQQRLEGFPWEEYKAKASVYDIFPSRPSAGCGAEYLGSLRSFFSTKCPSLSRRLGLAQGRYAFVKRCPSSFTLTLFPQDPMWSSLLFVLP